MKAPPTVGASKDRDRDALGRREGKTTKEEGVKTFTKDGRKRR